MVHGQFPEGSLPGLVCLVVGSGYGVETGLLPCFDLRVRRRLIASHLALGPVLKVLGKTCIDCGDGGLGLGQDIVEVGNLFRGALGW